MQLKTGIIEYTEQDVNWLAVNSQILCQFSRSNDLFNKVEFVDFNSVDGLDSEQKLAVLNRTVANAVLMSFENTADEKVFLCRESVQLIRSILNPEGDAQEGNKVGIQMLYVGVGYYSIENGYKDKAALFQTESVSSNIEFFYLDVELQEAFRVKNPSIRSYAIMASLVRESLLSSINAVDFMAALGVDIRTVKKVIESMDPPIVRKLMNEILTDIKNYDFYNENMYYKIGVLCNGIVPFRVRELIQYNTINPADVKLLATVQYLQQAYAVEDAWTLEEATQQFKPHYSYTPYEDLFNQIKQPELQPVDTVNVLYFFWLMFMSTWHFTEFLTLAFTVDTAVYNPVHLISLLLVSKALGILGLSLLDISWLNVCFIMSLLSGILQVLWIHRGSINPYVHCLALGVFLSLGFYYISTRILVNQWMKRVLLSGQGFGILANGCYTLGLLKLGHGHPGAVAPMERSVQIVKLVLNGVVLVSSLKYYTYYDISVNNIKNKSAYGQIPLIVCNPLVYISATMRDLMTRELQPEQIIQTRLVVNVLVVLLLDRMLALKLKKYYVYTNVLSFSALVILYGLDNFVPSDSFNDTKLAIVLYSVWFNNYFVYAFYAQYTVKIELNSQVLTLVWISSMYIESFVTGEFPTYHSVRFLLYFLLSSVCLLCYYWVLGRTRPCSTTQALELQQEDRSSKTKDQAVDSSGVEMHVQPSNMSKSEQKMITTIAKSNENKSKSNQSKSERYQNNLDDLIEDDGDILIYLD